MTERNNELLSKLQELIDIKDKDEAYTIIKYYIFMIDNKDKFKIYKKSNAENFFNKIKELIMTVKINYDENCKNFYASYIKNLSYIFYMINLNLLGTSICREENIEKYKIEINSLYNEYKTIIENTFESLETNCFTKIDEYIAKVRNYKDPKKESQTISEEILKTNEELYQYLDKKIKEYIKKMEDIKQKVIENEIENNFMNISFDNEIYKNFSVKPMQLSMVVYE